MIDTTFLLIHRGKKTGLGLHITNGTRNRTFAVNHSSAGFYAHADESACRLSLNPDDASEFWLWIGNGCINLRNKIEAAQVAEFFGLAMPAATPSKQGASA
ncbi:hypothetical protein ACQQ2N_12275 [Dokdonella sp. MW10]|uniref:hypothetical protein n=1 Tax=Dokdonella sp. MW10 TaxID=2992926 RepID=UPI003F804F7F